MFDSAPPNLPVEPPAVPPPAKPPVPPSAAPMQDSGAMPLQPPVPSAVPAPAVRPLSMGTDRKEPEDIFSGLDTANPTSADLGELDVEPARHTSKMTFILLAVLIVLLVAAGGVAAWYFLIREKPATTPITTTTTSQNPAVVTADDEPIVEIPPVVQPSDTQIPPNLPPPQSITTSTQEEVVVPEEDPILRTESPDTDGDGLRDAEEIVLGTEISMADTDGDGFSDGSELMSGYDPAAARLSQSASPRFQTASAANRFTMVMSASWTLVLDPSSSGNYVIQTGTPTTFPVRIAVRSAGQTFSSWLMINEPTRSSEDFQTSRSAGGYTLHTTFDGLLTYIELPDMIVSIAYEPNASLSYDYRGLYRYLIESLRAQ
jgi:hypothetical protein